MAAPGARVADFCDEGAALVLSFLAIGLSGGVVVPLDPANPELRLRALVEDADAAIGMCVLWGRLEWGPQGPFWT